MTGTISGNVFQDYNYNGARDAAAVIVNNGSGTIGIASDRGVQGIQVTAYTPAGAVAGTSATDEMATLLDQYGRIDRTVSRGIHQPAGWLCG
jgi:hypothetical protein